MSVLNNAVVSPSRVRGVYRYLLWCDGQREDRGNLERAMSPDSLLKEGKKRDMIHNTVNECIKMKLVVEDGGTVAISPDLPKAARHPETGDQNLPITLSNLFFTPVNEENHDLGRVIAWYLCQDVYEPPGSWKEVGETLREQVGADKLGLRNDARYGQLEDWACYLGFAWCHSRKREKMLVPDPTANIRVRLGGVFGDMYGKTLSIAETTRRLSEMCPVLEGGVLRGEIESAYVKRDESRLSSATSHAWFRLQDEGLVRLSQESDADVFVLIDGDTKRRFTDITWLGGGRK